MNVNFIYGSTSNNSFIYRESIVILLVLLLLLIIIIIIIYSLEFFTSALADGFSLESE